MMFSCRERRASQSIAKQLPLNGLSNHDGTPLVFGDLVGRLRTGSPPIAIRLTYYVNRWLRTTGGYAHEVDESNIVRVCRYRTRSGVTILITERDGQLYGEFAATE